MEKTKKLKKVLFWWIAAGLISLLLLNFQYFVEILTSYFYEVPEEVVISAKMKPNRLMIPALDVEAPIVYVQEQNEEEFQKGLRQGVVHYPGTAEVGKPGNPFIFGHSSDYPWAAGEYKTVFARLPQIKTGDLVIASDKESEVFRYKVTETLVVDPNQTEYLSQHNYERRLLTLQTSYPVGTALKRFLIIAEITSP